jgi:hypothetical protein
MSKVPDQVLLPFKEPMAGRLDFDVAGPFGDLGPAA